MKKNDKIRLKKYARTFGVLALGITLGFSTAHFSMANPEKALAETPKLQVTQIEERAQAKAEPAKEKKNVAKKEKKLAKAKGKKHLKSVKNKPSKAVKTSKAKHHAKKKRA